MNMALRYKRAADLRAAQRGLYHLAYDHPEEVLVDQIQTETTEGTAAPPATVYGEHQVVSNNIYGHTVRRNLTLRSRTHGTPLLQRFGPRYYTAHLAILQAIKVGRHRYDKVFEHCSVQATASKRAGRSTANKRTCQRTAQDQEEPAPGALVLACAVPEGTEGGPHAQMSGAIDLNLVLAGSHNNVTREIVAQDNDGLDLEAQADFNQEEGGAGSLAAVGTKKQTAPASLESEPGSTEEPAAARFHFGVWYGQGSRFATTSSDTQQGMEAEAVVHVLRFMAWVRRYVQKFVEPLTKPSLHYGRQGDSDQPVLCPEFLSQLAQRQTDFRWLTNEVPIAQDLCHPIYNACSPFHGYSGHAHRDRGDAAPTLLLNFGYARLHLPEYNIEVDLQPGEVVFFDASVQHYTTAHPQCPATNDELSQRWAISCFAQKRVHGRWQPVKYPKQLDMHRQLRRILEQDAQPNEKRACAQRCDPGTQKSEAPRHKPETQRSEAPHQKPEAQRSEASASASVAREPLQTRAQKRARQAEQE